MYNISKLLLEAAELLNEGSGSRRTKADRQEKEKEFYIEKQRKMPSYETFKKIQDYDTKGFERENYARQMYDREKSFGKWEDSDKLEMYKKHANNAEKMANADFDNNRNKILGYNTQRAHDISEKSKRTLDRFEKSVKSEEKAARSKLDKTKKAYTKLQNESIATLLTEAALLIHESSGVNGLLYRVTKDEKDNTKTPAKVRNKATKRLKTAEILKLENKKDGNLNTINSNKNEKGISRATDRIITNCKANLQEAEAESERRANRSKLYLEELMKK